MIKVQYKPFFCICEYTNRMDLCRNRNLGSCQDSGYLQSCSTAWAIVVLCNAALQVQHQAAERSQGRCPSIFETCPSCSWPIKTLWTWTLLKGSWHAANVTLVAVKCLRRGMLSCDTRLTGHSCATSSAESTESLGLLRPQDLLLESHCSLAALIDAKSWPTCSPILSVFACTAESIKLKRKACFLLYDN